MTPSPRPMKTEREPVTDDPDSWSGCSRQSNPQRTEISVIMSAPASLLDPLILPAFSQLTPDQLLADLDVALARHTEVVARIVAERPDNFAALWLPLEEATNAIDALWSAASHLQRVADTPAFRQAFGQAEKRLIDHTMVINQNRELYDVLATFSTSPAFADLADEDRVAIERAIRAFTLSGIALDPADREHFRRLSTELSELSTAFGNAVLDATDAWSEHVLDEDMLAGLSEPDKAMLAAAARAGGKSGWLVTLQQPTVNAVLMFATNRALRERVYRAYGTRASDQGPDAGRFDNSARIADILQRRHKAAALLGFNGPVDWSLATKMASDSDEILAFLRDLAKRARPFAERESEELKTFAATQGIDQIQPWDLAFFTNHIREDRYALDEQHIREYFPIDAVLAVWQALLDTLFGIQLVGNSSVELWHESARYYDVVEGATSQIIAGLYLDLHARPGKKSGAWMSDARPRLAHTDSPRVPVAYLTCNFAPFGGPIPSLLSHADVVTLLHETGHALHHLFTEVNRPTIAGVRGFEWDAIELPSQLMEDFAWDRDVLTSMSGHYQTGERLPKALFAAMLDARHFQAGMFVLRQVEYAMFNLLLHTGELGSDPMDVLHAVREEVAVVQPPEWHRFPHSFSHIFAGSYASGYYSYLWAEVLAADGFLKFVEEGTINRATGDLLRGEVLSRGAVRPAAESFRAFRGRDPDPMSILTRHGLV